MRYKEIRKIGGKRFSLVDIMASKRYANKSADKWRKKGYNARIIKTSGKGYVYLIYARKK